MRNNVTVPKVVDYISSAQNNAPILILSLYLSRYSHTYVHVRNIVFWRHLAKFRKNNIANYSRARMMEKLNVIDADRLQKDIFVERN